MLPTMKGESFLMRREPAEKADVDVIVVAGDVGIGVMDNIVFASPTIRTAAEQI